MSARFDRHSISPNTPIKTQLHSQETPVPMQAYRVEADSRRSREPQKAISLRVKLLCENIQCTIQANR